jgi:hypothetical protein
MRSRLRKIGYTEDIGSLSAFKAEAFCIISQEIDKIQEQDAKRRASKKPARKR